jgi:hypothetical protein
MRYRRLLVIASAWLLACGVEDSTSSSLSGDVSDAELEVDRHHQAIEAAEQLDEIREESLRHGAVMDPLMNHMGDSMASMHTCMGDRAPGMFQMLDAMHEYVDEHRALLEGARDRVSAQRACATYHGGMYQMLEDMRSAMDQTRCGMMMH